MAQHDGGRHPVRGGRAGLRVVRAARDAAAAQPRCAACRAAGAQRRCGAAPPHLRHLGRADRAAPTAGCSRCWRRRRSSTSTCSASPGGLRAGAGVGVADLHGRHVLCRRWLQRHGLAGAVRRGASFTLAGGAGMAGLAAAGCRVAVGGAGTAMAVYGRPRHPSALRAGRCGGPFPQKAGMASSLAGFVLAAVAFGIGLWLGAAMDGTATDGLGVGRARGPRLDRLDAGAAARDGRCTATPRDAPAGWRGAEAGTARPASAWPARRPPARRPWHWRWPTAWSRAIEIVSVDSALVYRGMDIGTAKPERRRAGAGAAPPDRPDRSGRGLLGGALRGRCARRLIHGIRERGQLPLLVGGTMLYFKALFDGLDALPAADPARAGRDRRRGRATAAGRRCTPSWPRRPG